MWISSKAAVTISGIPRKRLIELADQGRLRSQRQGAKGWRRYWRADIEALARPATAETGVDMATDPYHRFLLAIQNVERANALIDDNDRMALEAINPVWSSAIIALRALDNLFKAIL